MKRMKIHEPSEFWARKLQDKQRLIDEGALEKFRANRLSVAIDDSNGTTPGRKRAHISAVQAWQILRVRIDADLLHLCEELPTGHPATSHLGGRHCTVGSIQFAWLATVLRPYLKDIERIVEIGGGYGGLMRALSAAWLSENSGVFGSLGYAMVDFPPMLTIQRYYAESWGGDFNEVAPGTELPAADLYINTRSMFEMTIEQVNWYLDAMNENSGGHFFSYNKDKVTKLRDWSIPEDWKVVLDVESPAQASFRMQLWRIP